MPEFTCATCGQPFVVAEATIAKFPGWTPRQCLRCKNSKPGSGAATGGRRPRTTTLVEENLTTAEVLAKYAGGPEDGVFTDGSAVPNPGPGGWGAVYVVGGVVVAQDHGKDPNTTNNRMELTALIRGFDLVPRGTAATVLTDSRLCVDTITKWAAGWEERGWTRKGGPIKNLDLVQQLWAKTLDRPELELAWVAAHAGNRWNEYADSLSTAWLRTEV